VICNIKYPEFFRRKPETAPEGFLEQPAMAGGAPEPGEKIPSKK
jgi:hypothetical protein